MPRHKFNSYGIEFRGRRATAPAQTWNRWVEAPDGAAVFIRPAPGRTYVRGVNWPPTGRGKGESLTSPRRIEAKFRAVEIIRLRAKGCTWAACGRAVGLSTSGAYRAYRRCFDRLDWDKEQKKRQRQAR